LLLLSVYYRPLILKKKLAQKNKNYSAFVATQSSIEDLAQKERK